MTLPTGLHTSRHPKTHQGQKKRAQAKEKIASNMRAEVCNKGEQSDDERRRMRRIIEWLRGLRIS